MYLPLGKYSPDITLGLVSASRNCFPRSLSQERTDRLVKAVNAAGIKVVMPKGECAIIESKAHAAEAVQQLKAANCDAVVLYLGNFSPEIEDAFFLKEFDGFAMVLAAAEESANSLSAGRGDALCGLLSAILGAKKRGLLNRLHLPEAPVVGTDEAVAEIQHFINIMKVVKGARNATLGLFGPRPRDFESCNYNISAITSIGMEVEELGFFDLQNEVAKVKAEGGAKDIAANMKKAVAGIPNDEEFVSRLSDYEKALLNLRERLQLSGAASQCWSEMETSLKHVPCFINGRLADKGFPVACENDCYSLAAELLCQYASDSTVTVLDINHSIPKDLHPSLKDYPLGDMVGMFHCGNTSIRRLKNPEMKYQFIMKRMMEPDGPANITRGTIEGQIAASPITVMQVHGHGDKMQAYIAEGHFLDLDPKTFGCTGTAYIPGFRRFYRHVMLGKFHHHAAIAFGHCGSVLFDAFKLLGFEKVYTPLPDCVPYPGENVFRNGLTPMGRK